MRQVLHVDVGRRRARERRVWWMALFISALVHLAILAFGPTGIILIASTDAAGPDRGDDQATDGTLRAVSFSSAPPAIPVPPLMPVPDIVLPEPEVLEPEVIPEVAALPPEFLEPGVGSTTGTGPEDSADAGVAGATGTGNAGPGDEGRSRTAPPSPRGVIIPPTNRDLRGSEIEVWVFVNEQGRVVADSTQLRPPTSDRRFNEQLARDAAQWVFEPAREDGVPVAAWFPYVIGLE